MKAIFTTFNLFFFCSFLICQTHFEPYKLNDDGKLYMDLIHKDTMISKKMFFKISEKWIAKAFRNGKEVQMYSNEEDGILIGKGIVKPELSSLDVLSGEEDYLHYTINIFCREGRSKIVIDQIGIQTIGSENKSSATITDLEVMYWWNGDTNKKARKGFKMLKSKKADAIELVLDSWVKAIKGEIDNMYSEF